MYLLKAEPFEAFVTVPAAFQPHELEVIRSYLISPETGTVGANEVNPELRESRVQWLTANVQKYQWMYQKLAGIVSEVNAKYFGMDLRGAENIQLTEYDSEYKGFYGVHTDCGYGMSTARNRKLSIVMQLTDPVEYDGGELKLYWNGFKDPAIASKNAGDMTIFRSHILHEAMPVTRGKRLSLVSWIQGPLFK